MKTIVERAIEFYKKEGFGPTVSLGAFFFANFVYYRRAGLRKYNKSGVDVISEDWDNLIILDACRADYFTEQNNLPGTLTTRLSRGSSTSEFVRANFSNRTLGDTVYVAENGWFLKLRMEMGADVYKYYDLLNVNNPGGIERTVECVQDCVERYPHKRLLIHLIPPHHPFIGPTAEKYFPDYEQQLREPLFDQIRRGELGISDEALRQAYRENLDRVLPYVNELIDMLVGKTVITADHGELLGERVKPIPIKYYGHIPSLYVEELIEVPWLEYDGGAGRREIISDEPTGEIVTEYLERDDPVTGRLEDLGYKM